jgi:hypothetical protein
MPPPVVYPATDAERIEALRTPVERVEKSLRLIADTLIHDDQGICDLHNLASWLRGAYEGDPSYCHPRRKTR